MDFQVEYSSTYSGGMEMTLLEAWNVRVARTMNESFIDNWHSVIDIINNYSEYSYLLLLLSTSSTQYSSTLSSSTVPLASTPYLLLRIIISSIFSFFYYLLVVVLQSSTSNF